MVVSYRVRKDSNLLLKVPIDETNSTNADASQMKTPWFCSNAHEPYRSRVITAKNDSGKVALCPGCLRLKSRHVISLVGMA